MTPASAAAVAATSSSRGGREATCGSAVPGTTRAQASPSVWLPGRPLPDAVAVHGAELVGAQAGEARRGAVGPAHHQIRQAARRDCRGRTPSRRRGRPTRRPARRRGRRRSCSPRVISSSNASTSSGADDPVALATVQVEAHVALVLRRMGERARATPVDPAQLEPRGEVQCARARAGRGRPSRATSVGRSARQPPDRAGGLRVGTLTVEDRRRASPGACRRDWC